jgi:nucleoside-diphosphate-sugar epimerase
LTGVAVCRTIGLRLPPLAAPGGEGLPGSDGASHGELMPPDVATADLLEVASIHDMEELEEMLSRPTPGVVETMGRLEGDLILLGVGGKIGPSLARMARRASDLAGRRRRVLGAARFTDPALAERLEAHGVETIRCDLLDRGALGALPDVPNVLYLAAMKFGATGQEARTWAMNAYLPGTVCEKYATSRIVAYSTGNVYPFAPAGGGGPVETDPIGPVGEYAMSCLGRERVIEHFSLARGTPAALVRLNYAHEMRYGIMVDLARKVLAGEPIDATMGYFNAIWQGDSNAMTLQCFDHVSSPPFVINVTGPQTLGVRDVAERLAQLLGCEARIVGREAPDALLSNAAKAFELFGRPVVHEEKLIEWIADWHARGGPTLDKPTHFDARDGKF